MKNLVISTIEIISVLLSSVLKLNLKKKRGLGVNILVDPAEKLVEVEYERTQEYSSYWLWSLKSKLIGHSGTIPKPNGETN